MQGILPSDSLKNVLETTEYPKDLFSYRGGYKQGVGAKGGGPQRTYPGQRSPPFTASIADPN